jgi:hypothetical protein
MVQETINSIVEAEEVAESRIEKAKEEANKILLDSENKAEKLRTDAAEKRKQMIKQRDMEANEAAKKEAESVYSLGKEKADNDIKAVEGKKAAAVTFLMGSII